MRNDIRVIRHIVSAGTPTENQTNVLGGNNDSEIIRTSVTDQPSQPLHRPLSSRRGRFDTHSVHPSSVRRSLDFFSTRSRTRPDRKSGYSRTTTRTVHRRQSQPTQSHGRRGVHEPHHRPPRSLGVETVVPRRGLPSETHRETDGVVRVAFSGSPRPPPTMLAELRRSTRFMTRFLFLSEPHGPAAPKTIKGAENAAEQKLANLPQPLHHERDWRF